MATRHLGSTQLKITPIGLGVWQFSEGSGSAGFVWRALSSQVEGEQDGIPLILMDSDGQNMTLITGTQVQKAESGDLIQIVQQWRG